MLHSVETARRSTIVPLAFVAQSLCQQDTAHPLSSVFSYAIGPIDPAHLLTMHVHLSTGEQCALLTPRQLPLSILTDPPFRDGYERNCATEEEEEKAGEWTVA